MAQEKKAQAKAQAENLFESVLVDYSTELVDYKGKTILELTIHNVNKETGKPFKYQKFFWVIEAGEAFEFALFKAKRHFDTLEDGQKSFAIYGTKGLIKTMQADGIITEEI